MVNLVWTRGHSIRLPGHFGEENHRKLKGNFEFYCDKSKSSVVRASLLACFFQRSSSNWPRHLAVSGVSSKVVSTLCTFQNQFLSSDTLTFIFHLIGRFNLNFPLYW